jgi:hypothetical protein
LEVFVSRETVEAVTFLNRLELPPIAGVTYLGAVDAAGGSGGDSMTAAVAHAEKGVLVLDAFARSNRRSPRMPSLQISALSSVLIGSAGFQEIVGARALSVSSVNGAAAFIDRVRSRNPTSTKSCFRF